MISYGTERLILTQVDSADSQFIYTLLNSPSWIKYIGDRNIKTLADAHEYIQTKLIYSYKRNNFGLLKLVLKSTGESIGLCGLLQRDYLDFPDLGFALLPEFEGKGYMKEAAIATLAYTNSMKVERILAFTTSENARSQRLLEAIGMQFLGLRKFDQINEEVRLYGCFNGLIS